MPTGKIDIKNLDRAARLMRALAGWDRIVRTLAQTCGGRGEPMGLEINVGHIESCGSDEVVQPKAEAIVDTATGKLIAAAARKIIEDELRKLGVSL